MILATSYRVQEHGLRGTGSAADDMAARLRPIRRTQQQDAQCGSLTVDSRQKDNRIEEQLIIIKVSHKDKFHGRTDWSMEMIAFDQGLESM